MDRKIRNVNAVCRAKGKRKEKGREGIEEKKGRKGRKGGKEGEEKMRQIKICLWSSKKTGKQLIKLCFTALSKINISKENKNDSRQLRLLRTATQ